MKIIISQSMLTRIAQYQINNNAKKFIVTQDKITFHGKIIKEYYVHTDIKDGQWNGVFNPIQWYKLMQFVKELTEQPLVVELKWYAHTNIHEKPEFTLSQFVKSF